MDIIKTDEYFIAQAFVYSNTSEDIIQRFAELLVKMNEMNTELECVRSQLHETARKLNITIENVRGMGDFYG